MNLDTSYENQYIKSISKGFNEAQYEIEQITVTRKDFFNAILSQTETLRKKNGRLFFIGNGASSAFANHMALDWSKNGSIESFSLSDSSLLTALANDFSYEDAFVEFMRIRGVCQRDLVVTVSSSGNSSNVENVLRFCNKNGIRTFGLSGLKSSNKTRMLATYSLYVPMKTYGIVECIHQIFLHLWLDKSMRIFEWDRDEIQNMNSKEFKL